MNLLWVSALLLAAGSLLMFTLLWQMRSRQRQVLDRMRNQPGGYSQTAVLLQSLGSSKVAKRSLSMDEETQILLNRIGWRSARQRSLFAALQIGIPVLLAVVVVVVQWLFFGGGTLPWLAPVFAAGVGYLIPKRVLASKAAARQKQLGVEISTFIPLLRILFEVGMTVEQALRVLSIEGHKLLPELSQELRVLLVRVDSGLELGEELNTLARLLRVDEVTDCFTILEQLIYQGAGAMNSLLALKQLIDDRRLTTLQEYISKLSAKMSIVMMVFLFPALLIVLAGPGFTAIIRAFGEMG